MGNIILPAPTQKLDIYDPKYTIFKVDVFKHSQSSELGSKSPQAGDRQTS